MGDDNGRLRRVVTREKFVKLLDGDRAAAIVLDQMIAWQRYEDDQPGDRWFYKSRRQLSEQDMFRLYDPATVGRKLNKLEELGYLRSTEPDDPTHARNWRVKVTALNRDLAEFGASVDGYTDMGQPDDAVHDAPSAVHDAPSAVHDAPRGGAQCTANAPAHNAGAQRNETERDETSEGKGETQGAPAREDPPTGTTVPDYSEFFDGEPPDERPRAGRMDPHYFSQLWRQHLGESYRVHDQLQRRRALCAGAYFSEDEIVDALKATKRQADRPSWGYFRAVLQSDDGSGEGEEFPETGGVDPEKHPGLAEAKRRMQEGSQ